MKDMTLEEAKVLAKKVIGPGPSYSKKHMYLAAGMLAKAGMSISEICAFTGLNSTDATRVAAENS